MSHCWNNVLIKANSTIREALEIINNEALRVVLVINEHHELLGVVTDGDIRRGILDNLSLAAPVTEVMNTSPVTAT